jgi:gliding motility-associated-like protein
VTDANNCASIVSYDLTQPDVAITINADVTKASCLQQNDGAIQLDVQFGTEPYTYEWSNGELNDYIENVKAGNYYVTVTDANNCKATDSITVDAIKESCLHVYNTLTPNGDGKNDTWIIDGIENYPNVSVKVFNQWGNLVWEHNGYYESWDGTKNGKLLPAATYYYIIDLGNGDRPIRGDLTLIIPNENKLPQKTKSALPLMHKNKSNQENNNL